MLAASAAAAIVLAACSIGSSAPAPLPREYDVLRGLNAAGAGKIEHVVYVVQENRSFDDMFQGYPGADTVSSGKDSTEAGSSSSRCQLKTQYRNRPFGVRNVHGVRRNRQAARERSAGWTASIARIEYGGPQPRTVRRTCRTWSRSRTGTWRTSGSWPTRCSRPSSTRVSSRINTSSRRRPNRASTFPTLYWGCAGNKTDRRKRSRNSAAVWARAAGVFRLRDARGRARSGRPDVALLYQPLPDADERTVVGLSSGQAHFPRARLEERHHHAAKAVSHRRSRREARELHVDNAALRGFRSPSMRRRIRTVVGQPPSSTRSGRASFGSRP